MWTGGADMPTEPGDEDAVLDASLHSVTCIPYL